MDNREEVMDKIAKLLRLGGSSNAAEAALAIEKAQELSLRYGVEMEACRGLGEEKIIEERENNPHMSEEEGIVASLIDTHFAVRVLCDIRSGQVFFGTPFNVSIARHVYGFLLEEMRRGMDSRALYATSKRKAYAAGFAYEIGEKLAAAPIRNDAGVSSMVLASKARINQEIERRYSVADAKTGNIPSRLDQEEVAAGKKHGARTDVRRPLGEATDRSAQKLTA
jgi:hypothetical protein